jgi:hypothetical protein
VKFLNQTKAAASLVLLAMASQNADAAIRIDLEVATLPANYPICQPSWIAGELAFSWEVYFDLDDNTATGSFGSDAKLFVGHWNTCLDYNVAYTSTLSQLQQTLYLYNASSGLFVEVEASTPPQVSAQSGNTLSVVLNDSGILRQLTQQSKIVPRAWYRPFGQVDGRGDLLTGFVIEQGTLIGPGLWDRTDAANDLTGCSGCAVYAPFESAMDIRAVRIQLDAIFVSGLE